MDLPQLWFWEIRPRLGEDKKMSKYGIIGKIYLTGLREIPATTHRMMVKILWGCRYLYSCMVHPTIELVWPKSLLVQRYQYSKSASQPYLHRSWKMSVEEIERSSRKWKWSWLFVEENAHSTNALLKKIPTAHGDIVGCCFFYSSMVSFCPNRPWRRIYGLATPVV